ncbi:MAG: cysteine desulfurase [Cycloclasticus sp. symbiont of Bathymodiolus heckerae]|nr:MAG: cysteine desulfurase [Cycloclasticus sp. symbiont of Bathymodiolus heckerae]
MIYFDHNATTPIDPQVLEAMQPFLTTFYGNPSSLHRHGRAVKTAIDQARQQIAALVKVSPEQVIFTSGGTEANNIAISAAKASKKGHALMSSTEHPSIVEPMQRLALQDIHVEKIAVNSNGLIAADILGSSITSNTGFISIMQANNETGVIQDIATLGALAKERGIIFHTDAVQSCGKLDVDFGALNVNLMSLSGHKIYGPKGVGALVYDKKVNLSPVFYGGGQETRLRPGTENVAGIIGFGKAAELALQLQESRATQLLGLRKKLEEGISGIAGLVIAGSGVERLPNTSQILMDTVDGEMLLMQLDQQSIAVSSGSACSSNSKLPSPVLKAMGYKDKLALSAIRVSLGQQSTLEEVDVFIAALKATINR